MWNKDPHHSVENCTFKKLQHEIDVLLRKNKDGPSPEQLIQAWYLVRKLTSTPWLFTVGIVIKLSEISASFADFENLHILYFCDLLNAPIWLPRSISSNLRMNGSNLHHCNYFLGKQDGIVEWPATADVFYFSASIYARK